MASKEYVSIFVSKETRKRLKTKAVQSGFPSMIVFLEVISKVSVEKLRTVLIDKNL